MVNDVLRIEPVGDYFRVCYGDGSFTCKSFRSFRAATRFARRIERNRLRAARWNREHQ